MTGNYGILDPNINEILEPLGIEKLIGSNPGMAMLPGLMNRRDSTIQQVMQMIQGNNKKRAEFAQQKLNDDAANAEMDYLQNLTGHLKDFKSGNPEDVTAFSPLIRRGSKSFGIQHLINQNATKAYTAAQEAEARHKDVDVGFEPPAGGGPNMPRTFQGNPKLRAAEIGANTETEETVKSPTGRVLNIIEKRKLPRGSLDRSAAPIATNPREVETIQNYTETEPSGNTYKPFKDAAVEVLPNQAGVVVTRKNKNGGVEKILIPYKNGSLDMTAGKVVK